jgi:hypothetical protein
MPSAQAAGRGVKRMRGSADLAAPGESVVREFLQRRDIIALHHRKERRECQREFTAPQLTIRSAAAVQHEGMRGSLNGFSIPPAYHAAFAGAAFFRAAVFFRTGEPFFTDPRFAAACSARWRAQRFFAAATIRRIPSALMRRRGAGVVVEADAAGPWRAAAQRRFCASAMRRRVAALLRRLGPSPEREPPNPPVGPCSASSTRFNRSRSSVSNNKRSLVGIQQEE